MTPPQACSGAWPTPELTLPRKLEGEGKMQERKKTQAPSRRNGGTPEPVSLAQRQHLPLVHKFLPRRVDQLEFSEARVLFLGRSLQPASNCQVSIPAPHTALRSLMLRDVLKRGQLAAGAVTPYIYFRCVFIYGR